MSVVVIDTGQGARLSPAWTSAAQSVVSRRGGRGSAAPPDGEAAKRPVPGAAAERPVPGAAAERPVPGAAAERPVPGAAAERPVPGAAAGVRSRAGTSGSG